MMKHIWRNKYEQTKWKECEDANMKKQIWGNYNMKNPNKQIEETNLKKWIWIRATPLILASDL